MSAHHTDTSFNTCQCTDTHLPQCHVDMFVKSCSQLAQPTTEQLPPRDAVISNESIVGGYGHEELFPQSLCSADELLQLHDKYWADRRDIVVSTAFERIEEGWFKGVDFESTFSNQVLCIYIAA